ncbi:unnamed protein product [Rhodiola kirilowii]
MGNVNILRNWSFAFAFWAVSLPPKQLQNIWGLIPFMSTCLKNPPLVYGNVK